MSVSSNLVVPGEMGSHYSVLDVCDWNNQTFRIVELQPSFAILQQMAALYEVGFGPQHPMTDEEHTSMINHGIVLGILTADDRLIAMRALVHNWKNSIPVDPPFLGGVHNWKNSIPVDPPFLGGQAEYPYQNHTIIHPDYRHSFIGEWLSDHTRRWLKGQGHGGLRTSVAPWNMKNIGYLTKTGWILTDLVENLYGAGAHRFHGCYVFGEVNDAYKDKADFCRRIAAGDIPVSIEPGAQDPIIALKVVPLPTGDAVDDQTLGLLKHYVNDGGYDIIALLRGQDIWPDAPAGESYLIARQNGTKDSTRYGADTRVLSVFKGLKAGAYLEAGQGQRDSLDHALQHPLDGYAFAYDPAMPLTPDEPMVQHPLRAGTPWQSLDSYERTQIRAIAWPGVGGQDQTLSVLDATGCLTGSIKDHATEFVATFLAQQDHLDGTVLATTGNMGASEAAGLRKIGKVAHVFAPARTPEKKLQKIAKFGGEIHLIDGSYDDAVRAAKDFSAANPAFLYSGETPIRLAGNAVTAKMIVDKMGGYPDVIFVPVGDGAHYFGLMQGFKDLQRVAYKGGCTSIPAMIGVQVDECNPIYQALEAGLTTVTPQAAHTVAEAIAVGEPLYGSRILQALTTDPETGRIVSVPESSIPDAQEAIYQASGIKVEESSAVVWAALEAELSQQAITPKDKVLLLLTGHQSNTK